jgi:hypothetical protein
MEKKKPADTLKRFFDSCPTQANFDLTSDIAFVNKPKTMQKLYEKRYGFKPESSLYSPVVIQWSIKGKGFGELVFYRDGDKLYCQNECMSKETILGIMYVLLDKCILTDPIPSKKKKKGVV